MKQFCCFVLMSSGHRAALSEVGVLWNCLWSTREQQGLTGNIRLASDVRSCSFLSQSNPEWTKRVRCHQSQVVKQIQGKSDQYFKTLPRGLVRWNREVPTGLVKSEFFGDRDKHAESWLAYNFLKIGVLVSAILKKKKKLAFWPWKSQFTCLNLNFLFVGWRGWPWWFQSPWGRQCDRESIL